MASRLELHEELCSLLGSTNVYFQPPESIKLKYDCIIYSKNNMLGMHANNKANYIAYDRYEIIVIYRDPDNDLSRRIVEHFNYCRLDRHYVADNLYHDAITLYH